MLNYCYNCDGIHYRLVSDVVTTGILRISRWKVTTFPDHAPKLGRSVALLSFYAFNLGSSRFTRGVPSNTAGRKRAGSTGHGPDAGRDIETRRASNAPLTFAGISLVVPLGPRDNERCGERQRRKKTWAVDTRRSLALWRARENFSAADKLNSTRSARAFKSNHGPSIRRSRLALASHASDFSTLTSSFSKFSY